MAKKKYIFFKKYIDDGEYILRVAHKHVLVLKIDAAKTIFFGIIMPFFFYLLLPNLWFAWLLWLIGGFFGFMYHFIDWYYDAWILTNLGVIDIERDGIFNITSTRIDYHMMEGIAYTVNGFIRTVFNYGDITIDKLGSKTSVILRNAANPRGLERYVMKYQEKFVSNKSITDHQALKDMLAEMIAYHAHNNKIKKPR